MGIHRCGEWSIIRKAFPCHNFIMMYIALSLDWRHNERVGVSNYRCPDCLLNRLFRHRSKQTSNFCFTGLCEEKPPVTGGFPSERTSNAEMFPFDDVITIRSWYVLVRVAHIHTGLYAKNRKHFKNKSNISSCCNTFWHKRYQDVFKCVKVFKSVALQGQDNSFPSHFDTGCSHVSTKVLKIVP